MKEFNIETYEKLIEKEVNDRVNSTINQFSEIIEIHFKSSELAKKMNFASMLAGHYRSAIKAEGYFEAVKSMKDIVEKEFNMGSPHHKNLVEDTWKRKEKAVDKISDRILRRGTREYMPSKSFINDAIEELLYM